MKSLKPAIATLGLAGALVGPALAQRATPEEMGEFADAQNYATLHLQSNLGSFKTRPRTPTGKAEGRFEISFTGSLLLSDHEGGNVQVAGDLVKEYEGMGRTVYHGSGTVVVTGKWRSLQWFGANMNATWYGNGLVNVIGEFDKDLKTGEYWYDDPLEKGTWPSTTWQLELPEKKLGVAPGVEPKKRGEGG